MTIDKDERESLHLTLDYLLNTRQNLERVYADSSPENLQSFWAYKLPRHEFFWDASNFLRRVLGPKIHSDELRLLFDMELEEDTKNAAVLSVIAHSLRAFLPLFMERAAHRGEAFDEENIRKIVADLMGVYFGDEPRFFATAKKQKGAPKRPYRLALLRLAALKWDKYLAAAGLSAFERHRVISEAFRTEWDTIRKWAKPMEQQFGWVAQNPAFPDDPKEEFADNPAAVFEAIRRDGDAYWLEKSTASSGKRT